ncbi:MAG: S1C family serine protease [Kofleriaceae bacterium]
MAAPAGAAAGPTNKHGPTDQSVEVFEWSMGKGRLGMTVMGLTRELRTHFGAESQTGMMVGSIVPDSPAAKAGVQVGDVVVKTNGHLVDDIGDIRSAIARSKNGATIEIEVIRDRKPLSLKATLVDDPASMPDLDASWHTDWLRELMKPFEQLSESSTNA